MTDNHAPVRYYAPVQYPAPQMYYAQPQGFKGGFHPLYIWSIACVVLTYGYIALFVVSSNYLRQFTGTESSGFSSMFLFLPLFLTVANTIVTAVYGRKLDRRYLLGAALILK